MIRKLVVSLFSVLVGAGPLCYAQSKSVAIPVGNVTVTSTNKLVSGRVNEVMNGDTVSINSGDGGTMVIRLQAVDAPDEKQNYFKKSRKNLSELLLNKDVTVVLHKTDSTGINIGSVFVEGRDIGLLQIELGMAWHYKKQGYDQTTTSRKLYTDAEAKARAAGMGLWEDKKPEAPWLFRRETPLTEPLTINAVSDDPAAAPISDGRKYQLGPRGGCYYVSESGRKVYVKDKTLCLSSTVIAKP